MASWRLLFSRGADDVVVFARQHVFELHMEIWIAKDPVAYFCAPRNNPSAKSGETCSAGYRFAGKRLEPPHACWLEVRRKGQTRFLPLAPDPTVQKSSTAQNVLDLDNCAFVCGSSKTQNIHDTDFGNSAAKPLCRIENVNGCEAEYAELCAALDNLEEWYTAELDAWRRYDEIKHQQRPDPTLPGDKFDARATNSSRASVRKATAAKKLTNNAVAKSAAVSSREIEKKSNSFTSWCLILDGAKGHSTQALIANGISPNRILTPNIVPDATNKLR